MARTKFAPKRPKRATQKPELPQYVPKGKYPAPLEEGVNQIFHTMAQHAGGREAIPHAERCIDNLIKYGILEPHKIGNDRIHRRLDPKQLNLKLGLLAAMHSFQEPKAVMDVLPSGVFQKYDRVMEAHYTLCKLRDNDLGDQDSRETARLLKKPSLGLLVWMADLAQCRDDSAETAQEELGGLDEQVFAKHNVGPGSDEYRSLAMAALNIYSQLADALDYRDLSGDLMEMAYLHLQSELHNAVREAFSVTSVLEENTRSLLEVAIAAIEGELAEEKYEVKIHVRETKNSGKAMAKVHKKLREKCLPINEDTVLNEVAALNDRVAFTIVVNKYDGKTVKQSDLKRFDDVALIALRAIDSLKSVLYVDPEKLAAGRLDKENLMKKRGKEDGIYRNYIKKPKDNGYQALHLDVDFGDINFANLEVQIKNATMYKNSMTGTAAHALYKGGGRLVRRAQKMYRKVLTAIERGYTLLSGSAGVVSTMNVEVIEKNGSTRKRVVVLNKDAIVADALAEAGVVDFLNGYKLSDSLRPGDKIGSIRRIEVEHSEEHRGTLFMGLMNMRVEDATTDSARNAIHKARKEVSKWLRNGRREC